VSLTIRQRLTSHEASVNFLDGTKIEQQRILLAVYPLLLVPFSFTLSLWLTLASFQFVLLHPGMDDSDSVMLASLSGVSRLVQRPRRFNSLLFMLYSLYSNIIFP